MKKAQIIIYLNNTGCVEGKFLSEQQTSRIIEQHGIEVNRTYDAVYNTPDARIVAFGRLAEPVSITAARAGLTTRARSGGNLVEANESNSAG